MSLKITLPFGSKENIKNLVFSILTKEYPLKIIELTNLIRKRYGRSVTFQAVRKAILALVSEDVLVREGNSFLINKHWVVKSKKVIDELHIELTKTKAKPRGIESIKGEISVFTFNSLTEMMHFWEDIIDDWFKHFKKGDYGINCWQGAHIWEGLLHLNKEKKVMGQLKKKKIKSYALSTGNTPLDRNIAKFYKSIGLKMGVISLQSFFDRSYYVGTYGNTIVQAHYPKKIVDKLDSFFKKNKTIEELDLSQLVDIANMKVSVKLTVIKNLEMAKHINKSIMVQM